MKNASEGETLGIYLKDEGEGEIRRGTDLSKGEEENPPRILKNRQMGALVAEKLPLGRRSRLGEEIERRDRRGVGAPFNTSEPNPSDISNLGSDISDRSNISNPNQIYPAQSDLANFLQKWSQSDISKLGRMCPMIPGN
jgi:hypothetical protein